MCLFPASDAAQVSRYILLCGAIWCTAVIIKKTWHSQSQYIRYRWIIQDFLVVVWFWTVSANLVMTEEKVVKLEETWRQRLTLNVKISFKFVVLIAGDNSVFSLISKFWLGQWIFCFVGKRGGQNSMVIFLCLHLAVGELKTHLQVFFPRGKGISQCLEVLLAVLSLIKVSLIFWP